MAQLRGAGIVRSERGPAGGYRLNRSPREITLERIVRVFQGPLAPIDCATRANPEPCPMEVGCALQGVWAEVRDQTIEILERADFATLAERSSGPWVNLPKPDHSTVGRARRVDDVRSHNQRLLADSPET